MSVKGHPDIVCGASCLQKFQPGTTVLVTIIPSRGSFLAGVSGDSYPVAGSLPHAMRDPGNLSEVGDGEQLRAREVYDVVSFEDLYAMVASNGRHVTQILHEFDLCCFAASGRDEQIQAYAGAANARTSGTFRTLIEKGQRAHDVSAWSIQTIEDDLRSLGIIK